MGFNFTQPFAEHPIAADFLLWWFGISQLQARYAGQLTSSLLDHHAELTAEHCRVGLGQIHGLLDAHGFQVSLHAFADTPYISHIAAL
jgi:hypothetical protein